VSAENNPIAQGQSLFRASPPGCFACHSVAPGVNLAGPTLAGLGGRAAKIVAAPDYKGKAKTAQDYIRESIVEPNAHLTPGAMYSANGQSFMPNNYGKDLTADQIDRLVAYLATLQ
jgi:nitric oxide reductase subunit C